MMDWSVRSFRTGSEDTYITLCRGKHQRTSAGGNAIASGFSSGICIREGICQSACSKQLKSGQCDGDSGILLPEPGDDLLRNKSAHNRDIIAGLIFQQPGMPAHP